MLYHTMVIRTHRPLSVSSASGDVIRDDDGCDGDIDTSCLFSVIDRSPNIISINHV